VLFNLLCCGLPRFRGKPSGCALILWLLELNDVSSAFCGSLLAFMEGAQFVRMVQRFSSCRAG